MKMKIEQTVQPADPLPFRYLCKFNLATDFDIAEWDDTDTLSFFQDAFRDMLAEADAVEIERA